MAKPLIDWGKTKTAKRLLLSGEYADVPTAIGPVALQMEVKLEFQVRLGTYRGDEGSRDTDGWADVERELRSRLNDAAERCVDLLATKAPQGPTAERILQIELFEGLEG